MREVTLLVSQSFRMEDLYTSYGELNEGGIMLEKGR